MFAVGLLFVGVGVAVHLFIFVLESLIWSGALARKIFGVAPSDVGVTRDLAFNQGFYNLFLALLVCVGGFVLLFGHAAVGVALIMAGAAVMAAAGVVLLVSSPSKVRPAAIQLVPPLVGCVLVALDLPTV